MGPCTRSRRRLSGHNGVPVEKKARPCEEQHPIPDIKERESDKEKKVQGKAESKKANGATSNSNGKKKCVIAGQRPGRSVPSHGKGTSNVTGLSCSNDEDNLRSQASSSTSSSSYNPSDSGTESDIDESDTRTKIHMKLPLDNKTDTRRVGTKRPALKCDESLATKRSRNTSSGSRPNIRGRGRHATSRGNSVRQNANTSISNEGVSDTMEVSSNQEKGDEELEEIFGNDGNVINRRIMRMAPSPPGLTAPLLPFQSEFLGWALDQEKGPIRGG